MIIRILASRHSRSTPAHLHYGRRISARAGRRVFLRRSAPRETASGMIRDGKVDVVQSAPSASWARMDKGEAGLPLHFALINQRGWLLSRSAAKGFRV